MKEFASGVVLGAAVAVIAMMLIAKLAIGLVDDTCSKQGWKGEACQCRLLDKSKTK